MTARVVIIDYGMGNRRSVQKAFQRLGHPAAISSDPDEIRRAERLVLPGVGHFAQGMHNLRSRSLIEPIRERVVSGGAPLLGICLGLQLLSRHSEEGDCDGLGWIDGTTIRLDLSAASPGHRVPHFGWNTIAVSQANPLVPRDVDATSFYFAHSYRLAGCPDDEVLATTSYGVLFPSVVRKANIMATQFHPEKSHRRGLALLARFLEIG